MNIPTELSYTKSHEWVSFTGTDSARIGLTWFAQDALGSIVFIELPGVGDTVSAAHSFAEAESVKAVSGIYCPISGTVSAVNEDVLNAPEMINDNPYEAWLIEVSGITEKTELLSAAEYEELCKKEA